MSENTKQEGFWSKLLTLYHESKEATTERLKMPIVTFYISLLIITYWQPLVILLFSSKPIEDRTAYIRCLYSQENIYFHYIQALFILIISFSFSVIFPMLTHFINKLTKTAKYADIEEKELQKDRARLDEEKQAIHDFKKANIKSGQLEKDEYNKSMEDLKFSYEKRIRSLEDNNIVLEKNYQESINQKEKTISTLSANIDKLYKESATMKDSILELIFFQNLKDEITNILSINEFLLKVENKYITILKEIETTEEQNIKKILINLLQDNSLGNITRSLPEKTVFKLNKKGELFLNFIKN